MKRGAAIMGTLALTLAMAVAAAGCAKHGPKDKHHGLTAPQIYDLALKQMGKKSYFRARETLQNALGRNDSTPELVAKVHLALADAYFLDGGILNLAEALSRYTNFLTFYPNHASADYAQYQLGLCYLKQTLNPDRDQAQTHKALDELAKVPRTYPNSDYLGLADKKADEARELLAEHDFRIATFYFKKGEYIGATQRFRQVLEAYPRYSRKDSLYLVLGRSLLALDKTDEACLYLQKLVAEFPDCREAGAARHLLKEPCEAGSKGAALRSDARP
jgi:outer membrane protein assembly factor BamD